MRVYVAWNYTAEGSFPGEVFVDEQDAKRYKADTQDRDPRVSVTITPRQLRTGWTTR